MSDQVGRRLVFLVTEDWYFCSHRLPLAVAAKQAGYDVWVLTRVSEYGDIIRRAGLNLIPIFLERRSYNPFRDLIFVWKLTALYRQIKPDILHHVALKPIIYGSIAAYLSGYGQIMINAMAGMGFIFTSRQLHARILKFCIRHLLRLVLKPPNSRLLLQNSDDVRYVTETGICDPNKIDLIRGAGVDTDKFFPATKVSMSPVVLLASRMLEDKGISVFVEAATILKKQRAGARFLLVGKGDKNNATSIPDWQLQQWHESGVVEWLGHRDDMPEVFASADLAVLPTTYGEGVPKFLIEAASCGLAIVATDWPGCREIVKHNISGLLIRPRDAAALAEAIKFLMENPAVRSRFGVAGRRLVEQEFSLERVIEQTLKLYGNEVTRAGKFQR